MGQAFTEKEMYYATNPCILLGNGVSLFITLQSYANSDIRSKYVFGVEMKIFETGQIGL